ncbi:MAG: hypothetical protein R3D58_06430 [Saprospiraceae bacterium]
MNTTIRAGWLTASWLLAAVVLTAQTTVQEHLSRADKQFDLYAYNLALRTYEQVLKEQPNNAHALARIGDCYFQLNKPEESLSWYDRAVVLGNAAPETLLNYGKALMQTGDYIGAKKWFILYSERNRDVGMHYAQMCDFALQTAGAESLFLVLNEPLNTASSDYGPAFFQSKIVYNSARTDIKRQTTSKTSADWTGSAYNQLYVTQRNPGDNYLQNPVFLRDDLQNNYNEGPVSFSADGRRVAYCRNNFIDGTRQIAESGMNMSLHLADVVEGKWINERAFSYNGSDFATGFPCLSPDGNTLYFASNQPGGFGGWDIYVSKWSGGTWSTPRNLGSPLNTPGNEVTPFFDGVNLFFSSDWHNGLGGLDVFRSDIQNDFVSNITHMGTGVNSSRDDYGFIYNPKGSQGYLTSNRPEGRGNEDIWQVRKTVDEFIITVTDPQRNPIANADIDFSACNAGIKQTDGSGKYSFAVASGKADCRVTVRKTGYSSTVIPVQSSGDKTLTAVLMPEYGSTLAANNVSEAYQPNTFNTNANNLAPATYSTTNYPVQNGTVEQYSVYVTTLQGQPIPAAELNLSSCGLATLYTDYLGRAEFYFPQGANCNLLIRKIGYEDATVPLNIQTSRNLTIPMRMDQLADYSGSVLDANTRYTLQNVVVLARSRQNAPDVMANTDIYGKYTLKLLPYQTYDISYKKDGYLDFTRAVQTERVLQGTATLPTVTLVPGRSGTTTNTIAPVTYNTTQPASGGMISLADLEEVAAGTAPPQPVTTQPPASNWNTAPQTTSDAPVTGYAIQLSANPTGYTDERIRKYDALAGLGNLYTAKEGALYKLRLGVFPDRDDATAVLNNHVTAIVKDAFVVQEPQATTSMLVGNPTVAQPTPTLAANAKGTPTPAGMVYAVQVASWPIDNTVLVSDYANLSHLGHTYIQPESNRLRVRVGTYTTYEQAQGIQAQATQLGYKDAIIVREDAQSLSNEKLLPSTSAAAPATTAPAQYAAPTSVVPIQAAETAKYYVRVCAVDNPNNFNQQQIAAAGGILEKWPIGTTNKTAIMLTGFQGVGQAMAATDQLRMNGYRDAYIIQDQNGRMSKYRY